jgi:hypothetical protein
MFSREKSGSPCHLVFTVREMSTIGDYTRMKFVSNRKLGIRNEELARIICEAGETRLTKTL